MAITGRIAIITKDQHRQIYGKEFAKDSWFAPRLDADGNIIIGEEEAKKMLTVDYPWKVDLVFKEPHEVLKTFETKEAEYEHFKSEALKEAQEYDKKLEDLKKPKSK